MRRARQNNTRGQQAHTWEERAKSCHRIREVERSKGRNPSKVVKQGKANTGKDPRSNQECKPSKTHRYQECNQRVGEMQSMQSRSTANIKCKNKQTYGTRQHCEPSQERKVKRTLTQAPTHQVTNDSKDVKSKRTKVKPSGTSLGWHLEKDWSHAFLWNSVPRWCSMERVVSRKWDTKLNDAANMGNHGSDIDGCVIAIPEGSHKSQIIS